MIKYSEQIIDEFPEEMTSTITSLVAKHLFKIWDDSERKLLPEE